MLRFLLLALVASLPLVCRAGAPLAHSGAPATAKVLRYAFPIAESGFDPAQVTDLYSNTVLANIFEAPLEYEYLAEPARVRANTAAGLPQVSDDFQRFVFRIQPGIHFADDPAFKGVARELTAADYVYSIKRHYDPRWKSGKLYQLEAAGILGLSELRRELIAQKKPFDYEREVEGLRVLDRYRFEVRLAEPSPRFAQNFTDPGLVGALAREVVEFYGDRIGEHPVGTGPYKLAQWTRSSKIVLERNPGFRKVLYDEHPPADDARRVAMADALRGRRLPIVERIEVAIIEQQQPRWLSFLNAEHDVIERVPEEFAPQAVPNNRARAAPGQARHPDAALPPRGCGVLLLCDGEPGGRRLHARQGGPAPRDLAGRRSGARDSPRAQQPGDSRAVDRRTAGLGLRPGVQVGDERVQPRQRPRHCSTCTAMSIATATAGARCPTVSRC